MTEEEIAGLCQRQRKFFDRGETRPYSFRLAALKKLKAAIQAHEEDLHQALQADLGKPQFGVGELELQGWVISPCFSELLEVVVGDLDF